MKKIGMLVAIEIDAVMDIYKEKLEVVKCIGYEVYKYKMDKYELYILKSGAGQIAAASGTQFLIDKFDVKLIINFGIVGGLTDEMKLSKTCIVKDVVHYDFDTSYIDNCEIGRYVNLPSTHISTTKEFIDIACSIYPDLKIVTCASGDKFVGDIKFKKHLNKRYNADIVEMEAAAILLTCNRSDIPVFMIKTVSDSIEGGPEEYIKEGAKSAQKCFEIVDKIINQI